MSKPSTMLKVVSILFIIFGAIEIITCITAMACGAVVTGVGAELGAAYVAVGWAFIVASILGLIGGVLDLLAGIFGVKGNLKAAKTLVIIIFVVFLISLILSIVGSSFAWTSLIGLVLPILYFIGIKQSEN